jgi:WD40 repeat protein
LPAAYTLPDSGLDQSHAASLIDAFQTGSGSIQVTYSPEGKTLATASTDGTLRLWDTATLQQIGTPLTADGITQAAFSPDGTTLATASVSPTPAIQLWTLPTTTSPVQLSQAICARGGHDLTGAQWAQYVPGIPYQRSCQS